MSPSTRHDSGLHGSGLLRSGRTRSRAGTRGFSLLEVMIAMAVLAMIAVMTWTAISQVTRSKEVISRRLDRHHALTAALERMSRELSMAYVSERDGTSASPVAASAFIGTDRGRGDRLDFTSFSHQRLVANSHESDQNELSYFLTADPENRNQTVLARREQNRIDEDPEHGGRVEILVRDVTDLEFEYLDPNDLQWVRDWDSTNTTRQFNRLPSQVRITLSYHDRSGRTRTIGTRAVVPLRFALNHANYNP